MSRLERVPEILSGVIGNYVSGTPAYCETYTVEVDYGDGTATEPLAVAPTQTTLAEELQALWDASEDLVLPGQEVGGVGVLTPNRYGGVGITGVRQETVTQCYDAVPGYYIDAASLPADDSVGWDAGARSVTGIDGDCVARFRVQADVVAMVVGFTDGKDLHSYQQAAHALAIRRQSCTPIQYGVDDAEPGPAIGDAWVEFRRVGTEVMALVDGVLYHTFSAPSTGTVYLDATLYSSNDVVFDASISALSTPTASGTLLTAGAAPVEVSTGASGAMQLSGLATAAVDGVTFAGASGQMKLSGQATAGVRIHTGGSGTLSLQGVARANGHRNGATLTLPPLWALLKQGGSSLNGIIAKLPSLSMTMGGGQPEHQPQGATLQIPRLTVEMSMRRRGKMSATLTLPPLLGGIARNDTPNLITVRLPPLWSWAKVLPASERLEMDVSALMFAGGLYSTVTHTLLALVDTLELGETFELFMVQQVAFSESLSAGDQLAVLSEALDIDLIEALKIDQPAPLSADKARQLAANVQTGAMTRYEDFGFSGYASAGGRNYGVRTDGLYQIGPVGQEQSERTLIDALIDFGAADFGSNQHKRLPDIFLGLATDGAVYVRVSVDEGQEYIYRATGNDQQLRAMLGRGLVGKSWRIGLQITDLTRADLDCTEIEVGAIQRRINGGRR